PLVYRIFEGFSRTELRHLGRFDLDRGTGAGIAPAARSALADIERPEPDQSDQLPLLERCLDRRHRAVQCATGGRLGDVGRLGDRIDEFLLVHVHPLSSLLVADRTLLSLESRACWARTSMKRARSGWIDRGVDRGPDDETRNCAGFITSAKRPCQALSQLA